MWHFTTNQDKQIKLVDEDQLNKVIDLLDLEPLQKEFIRARWLKYVMWWDKRSSESKGPYQRLRATAAIAGVITAALVGANLGSVEPDLPFRLLTLGTSLLVTACLALEEVYHYGDIWREKRNACERIKVEGFRFFQLTGRYGESESYRALPTPRAAWSHKDAYRDFANRIEGIIESEIGSYINVVSEEPYAGLAHRIDAQVSEAVERRLGSGSSSNGTADTPEAQPSVIQPV